VRTMNIGRIRPIGPIRRIFEGAHGAPYKGREKGRGEGLHRRWRSTS
jgi:hypothetical protein